MSRLFRTNVAPPPPAVSVDTEQPFRKGDLVTVAGWGATVEADESPCHADPPASHTHGNACKILVSWKHGGAVEAVTRGRVLRTAVTEPRASVDCDEYIADVAKAHNDNTDVEGCPPGTFRVGEVYFVAADIAHWREAAGVAGVTAVTARSGTHIAWVNLGKEAFAELYAQAIEMGQLQAALNSKPVPYRQHRADGADPE